MGQEIRYMSMLSVQPVVSETVNFNSEEFMLLWDILLECDVPFEKYDRLINCRMIKRHVKIPARTIEHLKFTLIFDSLT